MTAPTGWYLNDVYPVSLALKFSSTVVVTAHCFKRVVIVSLLPDTNFRADIGRYFSPSLLPNTSYVADVGGAVLVRLLPDRNYVSDEVN